MKKAVYLLLLLFLIYYGCIPIDDTIPPNVPELDTEILKESYYYKDSLSLIITHSDDSGLDTGRLEIFKASGDVTSITAWSVDSLLTLDNGRNFIDTLLFTIPPFVDIGTYQVRVTTEDLGGNISQLDTISFFVNTDITDPEFFELDLELNRVGDVFVACRTDIISVVGGVKDNLNLDFVGFRLDNGAENRKAVLGDSVSLSDEFTDQIIIPSDIPNKDTLDFVVFAIDTFDNRVSETFKILVDCDDEPPVIEVIETTPDINLNNDVNVVQGGELTLEDVTISDNDSIAEVQVYFNVTDQPLTDPIVIPIERGDGPVSIKLQDFANEGDLVFPIAVDEPQGNTFEVTLFALDGAGLNSVPYVINIAVIQNDPPEISLTEVYVNGLNTTTQNGDNYEVNIADFITFDAKIEDDHTLQSVTMIWRNQTQDREVNSVTLTDPVDLDIPINLFAFHDEDDFIIDSGGNTGDIYTLTVTATDNNGNIDEKIVSFIVLP